MKKEMINEELREIVGGQKVYFKIKKHLSYGKTS